MIAIFYCPDRKIRFRLDGSDDYIQGLFWLEELNEKGEGKEKYEGIHLSELEEIMLPLIESFTLAKKKQESELS